MKKREAEQLEFRRPLPVVVGNVDYLENETRLKRIDELLRVSGLEDCWIETCVDRWMKENQQAAELKGKSFRRPSWKVVARYQRMSRQALRCNIARQLTEKEFRKFSPRLAEGSLLQWFCGVDRVEQVRVPTKSTLERYDKLMPEDQVRALVDRLNRQTVDEFERLEHVIVRNKLDAEIEFGNTLLLAEQMDGLIVDWKLEREISPEFRRRHSYSERRVDSVQIWAVLLAFSHAPPQTCNWPPENAVSAASPDTQVEKTRPMGQALSA